MLIICNYLLNTCNLLTIKLAQPVFNSNGKSSSYLRDQKNQCSIIMYKKSSNVFISVLLSVDGDMLPSTGHLLVD